MEFKKKTIIWEENNEPPKNYIWVKDDGKAYEYDYTTRQWVESEEVFISPNGEVTITENGTYNIKDKASAVVNVPKPAVTANDITPELLENQSIWKKIRNFGLTEEQIQNLNVPIVTFTTTTEDSGISALNAGAHIVSGTMNGEEYSDVYELWYMLLESYDYILIKTNVYNPIQRDYETVLLKKGGDSFQNFSGNYSISISNGLCVNYNVYVR